MNPVLVNQWRGNAIECRYRGAVAVVDSSGSLFASLGDIQRAVFPRSAIKFLQAIPFVESGAVEAFGLDERHIALACASHNGEPIHAGLAQDWLERIGCDHDDLECGAQLPMHKATRPQRVHHNCSGKHLGLLSTCRQLKENTQNYRLYNHAAQQRLLDVMESLNNTRVKQMPWGYDGCAIPTVAMPLQRIALAMARFGDLSCLSGERREAVATIHSALTAQPYMVAGKERLCTSLMDILAPHILVKVGAAGVYTAVIPEHRLGIALKIDDGHDAAASVALGAVFLPSINNSRGEAVGRLEPSSDWEGVAA